MLTHMQADTISYAAFLAGQCLFLLKRAGSAMRNPNTDIYNRRSYFINNWDTFAIRAAMEFPFFYAWRHYGFASLIGLFGWQMPVWMAIPDSPLTAFFLGFAADSLLDWAAMSPKLPNFLRTWISENVPELNGNAKLKQKLDTAAAATKEAAVATKEAVVATNKAEAAVAEAKAISPATPEAPK